MENTAPVATATPEVAAPAPVAAAPVTPATEPKKAPSIADIKAARASGSGTSPVVSEAAKPAETAKAEERPKTIEVPYSAEAMAKIAELNATKIKLEQQLKEYEPTKSEAQKLTEAKAMAKAGKHLAAIEALGFDITAANLELLGQSPTHEQDTATSKEIAELKSQLAEVKKAEEQRRNSEVSAEVQAGIQEAVEHVKANAKTFPLLSLKDEWIHDTLNRARIKYNAEVAGGKQFTDEERDNFVAKALEDEEKKRAEDAKLLSVYLRDGNVADGSSQSGANSSRPNPNITDRGQLGAPVVKPNKKLSFKEVQQARRNSLRS